ncbi:hypothetical protein MNEG_8206, partial [Monoraphidium neglectum]
LNQQFQFLQPKYATDTNNTNILMGREYGKTIGITSSCFNSSESCYDPPCNVMAFKMTTTQGSLSLLFYPLYGAKNATHDLEMLRTIMRSSADMVILNHGLWGGDNMNAYFKDVLCPAKKEQPTLGGGKTELVWRTTYRTSPETPLNTEMARNLSGVARDCGWNVLDLREVSMAAAAINLPVYWDDKHFLPFVNDQISDILLNLWASLWQKQGSSIKEVCPPNPPAANAPPVT